MSAQSFMAIQSRQEHSLDRAILESQNGGHVDTDFVEVVDQLESGWDVILRNGVASTLESLPRDTLRLPDYRDVRPVAYYTFDAEDMNGQVAFDIAGENHIRLPSAYTRSGQAITSNAPQTVTIPRGAVEFYNDFEISLWLTVPPSRSRPDEVAA